MASPLPRLDPDTRREIILGVAREVFLEDGYAASSMAKIASRLGGSKGTLYKYFKSKEELFEAFVRTNCDVHRKAMEDLVIEQSDIRGSLTRLGRLFLDIVLADKNVRLYRVVVAESERTPEVGQWFYESAMMASSERIKIHMQTMAAAGALDLDDPMVAGQQFMALCQARLQKLRLCNIAPAPSDADIDREVDRAVTTFLKAFGA
jgi:AcrR family transcriptional regulator